MASLNHAVKRKMPEKSLSTTEVWLRRINLPNHFARICQLCTDTFIFWLIVAMFTMIEPVLCGYRPEGFNLQVQLLVLVCSSVLFVIQLIGGARTEWEKIAALHIEGEEFGTRITDLMDLKGLKFMKLAIFFTSEGEYMMECACLAFGWALIFFNPGLAALRCFRVYRLLWFYEVKVFKKTSENYFSPIFGHSFVNRVFSVLKFAIKALTALVDEMFRLGQKTRGGIILMMLFFYSAYILGAVLWIETNGSNPLCTNIGECTFLLMRLTFYDGDGFDFAYFLTERHKILFCIVMFYLALTAFGILNGLVGIFGNVFANASESAFGGGDEDQELLGDFDDDMSSISSVDIGDLEELEEHLPRYELEPGANGRGGILRKSMELRGSMAMAPLGSIDGNAATASAAGEGVGGGPSAAGSVDNASVKSFDDSITGGMAKVLPDDPSESSKGGTGGRHQQNDKDTNANANANGAEGKGDGIATHAPGPVQGIDKDLDLNLGEGFDDEASIEGGLEPSIGPSIAPFPAGKNQQVHVASPAFSNTSRGSHKATYADLKLLMKHSKQKEKEGQHHRHHLAHHKMRAATHNVHTILSTRETPAMSHSPEASPAKTPAAAGRPSLSGNTLFKVTNNLKRLRNKATKANLNSSTAEEEIANLKEDMRTMMYMQTKMQRQLSVLIAAAGANKKGGGVVFPKFSPTTKGIENNGNMKEGGGGGGGGGLTGLMNHLMPQNTSNAGSISTVSGGGYSKIHIAPDEPSTTDPSHIPEQQQTHQQNNLHSNLNSIQEGTSRDERSASRRVFASADSNDDTT